MNLSVRTYRILAAGTLFLLCCAVSNAQEAEKTGELILTKFYKTPIHSFDKIKIGGSIEGADYTYPYSVPNTDIRNNSRLIFKPFLDARLDEHVNIYGQMKLRTDLPQSTVRTRVIPQEAYLSINLNRLNIRGGYQIFSWGVADLTNPTDVLNPKDYTDIFDFEKEGTPALKIGFSSSKVTLEGMWMPIPDESELPYQDSRFVVPFLTTINNPLFPVFGFPPANYNATINNLDPEIKLKNSQFGARILATVGRFDLGLSYFNGYDKIPHLEVITGQPDPQTGIIPVTINEVYPREHVIGFNIATGFKGINLRTESALVIPYKTGHDIGSSGNLYYIYVVGGDYTFYELFGKHNFSITMEFQQQINSVKNKREDFGNVFQLSLFSRLEYAFSESFKIRLSSIYNFDNRCYYLQPEIMWEPIDDLELKLGSNILNGPGNTLLGLFDRQDRIYAGIKFYF